MRVDLLVASDGRVVARPAQYLGDDFQSFIGACQEAGGFYDAGAKAQVVPVESIPAVAAGLRKARFEVYVHAEVERAILEKAGRMRKEAVEFQGQIAGVEEALKERGLSLYRFQIEGVAKLQASDRFLLADEMGLGKTIQALAALPTHRPAVVVCPAAVKGVWAMECRKWRPDYRVRILSGAGSFEWPRDGELLITNYDVLPPSPKEATDAAAHGTRPPSRRAQRSLFKMERDPLREATTLIFDEAHALKSPKARRTRRAAFLCSLVRKAKGRIWMLTGTPILNRPPELWTLLRINGTAKEAFPGGWQEFGRLFHGRAGQYGYSWGYEPSPEVIDRIRRVSLKRRRTEVLPDLPRKVHRDIEVEIDEETRRAADKVLELLRKAGIDLDHAVDSAVSSKAMGVAFEEMSRVRALLATAKMPKMLEIADEYEEQEEPLVVFSAHRPPIDALGYRPGWATITGDTVPDCGGRACGKCRTEIVQRFQMGELKGLGITIRAGGVGLTLTRGAHQLFVDLEWTPALNSQAEDRQVRIGQTRGVFIQRLVAAHPLDERVAELLADKQRLIENSTDAAAVKEVSGAAGADQARALEALAADAARLRQEAEAAGMSARPAKVTFPASQGAPGSAENPRPGRRKPTGPREEWAATSLRILDGLSPDGARTKNEAGWSKYDQAFGHSLTDQLERSGMLTDRQWAACFRMLTKYHRQVGLPPAEEAPAVSEDRGETAVGGNP